MRRVLNTQYPTPNRAHPTASIRYTMKKNNELVVLSPAPMTSASFGAEHGEVIVDTRHEDGSTSFFTAGDNADEENPEGFKRLLACPDTPEWTNRRPIAVKTCVRRGGQVTPEAVQLYSKRLGRPVACRVFLGLKALEAQD